ncbi:hypothetical protein Syun_010306 [Stephania yunnanensis]|uniref:Pectin acetylesterase n=1 Tax=Stephania yunnanensis TaxID=152371 RepID=A0AAP0KIK0_9MAGN
MKHVHVCALDWNSDPVSGHYLCHQPSNGIDVEDLTVLATVLQFGIDESYKLTVPSTGNPICAHLENVLHWHIVDSVISLGNTFISQTMVLDAASREGAIIIDHWFVSCAATYVVCEGLHIHGYFGRTNNLITSVALSVGDWFFDRVGVSAIDCPYPCDNTCHNLVSK